MKKLFILSLTLVVLLSVSGCISKAEHDKLVGEKNTLEQKCQSYLTKEAGLRDQIARKDKELKSIRSQVLSLQTQLNEAKRTIEDLKTRISGAAETEIKLPPAVE